MTINPYEIIVRVVIGNKKELNRYMDKEKIDKINRFNHFIDAYTIGNFEKNRYYMLIRNDIKINLDVLVHECKHMVNYIFRARHVELDIYNDEPEAYLLGYLTKRVSKILVKHTKFKI